MLCHAPPQSAHWPLLTYSRVRGLPNSLAALSILECLICPKNLHTLSSPSCYLLDHKEQAHALRMSQSQPPPTPTSAPFGVMVSCDSVPAPFTILVSWFSQKKAKAAILPVSTPGPQNQELWGAGPRNLHLSKFSAS